MSGLKAARDGFAGLDGAGAATGATVETGGGTLVAKVVRGGSYAPEALIVPGRLAFFFASAVA